MDGIAKLNDIVLLFDNYMPDSRNLHISFRRAGYDCDVAVIEDDGFLPDGVLSVFGYFLGSFEGKKGIDISTRSVCLITGRSAERTVWEKYMISIGKEAGFSMQNLLING